MKIAVISDIHGNLAALEKVLIDVESKHIDKIVCLGDVVGYGARPNACVKRVRSAGITCALGNHDEAAFSPRNDQYFNFTALEAVQWTRGRLEPESLGFLSCLPISFEIQDCLFLHSSPSNPAAWLYIVNRFDAATEFDTFPHPICFVGHTHVPRIFKSKSPQKKMIVNVGSIGQPRDNDPRACWALFDSASGKIEFHRVEYPVRIAAEEILNAGLPPLLAERLFAGF